MRIALFVVTSGLAVFSALGPAAPAAAVEPTIEELRRARALSSDLMSPFCPGRTLADCPSPDAGAVNAQIRAWIGDGASDTEVRERLRARFGDQIEGGPRNLWGALLPIALLVLGACALVFVLVRVRANSGADGDETPPPDPELLAELERD